jgi:hypothetical protein
LPFRPAHAIIDAATKKPCSFDLLEAFTAIRAVQEAVVLASGGLVCENGAIKREEGRLYIVGEGEPAEGGRG